VQHKVKIFLLT